MKKGNRRNLSIISLNTFGVPIFSSLPKERYLKLCSLLNIMSVDIINLQEVHTYNLLNMLKKNLSAFPYIVYEASLLGPKGGLVTLSRHPFKKVEYLEFLYNKESVTFLRSLFLRFGLRNKGILISTLKNEPILIANVHLTANIGGNWLKKDAVYLQQKFELEQLGGFIKKTFFKKQNIILSGDFNIPKNDELYKFFKDGYKLTDMFKDSKSPTYHAEFLPKTRKPKCIDYIFIRSQRENITIKETKFLFKNKILLSNGKKSFLSDHVGIYGSVVI